MEFYGYLEKSRAETPSLLKEVTFVAEPQQLRQIASFIIHAASLIEKHGDAFDHIHLSDYAEELNEFPRFVVARKQDM